MASSLSSKCGSSAFLSLIPGTSICLIIQSEIWNSLLSTPFLLGVSSLSISLPQPSVSSPQKRRLRKASASTLLSFNNLSTEAFQEVEFTDVAGYQLSCLFSIHNCPKPVTSSILPLSFFPFGSWFSAPRSPAYPISRSVYFISILCRQRRSCTSSWGHSGVLPPWDSSPNCPWYSKCSWVKPGLFLCPHFLLSSSDLKSWGLCSLFSLLA